MGIGGGERGRGRVPIGALKGPWLCCLFDDSKEKMKQKGLQKLITTCMKIPYKEKLPKTTNKIPHLCQYSKRPILPSFAGFRAPTQQSKWRAQHQPPTQELTIFQRRQTPGVSLVLVSLFVFSPFFLLSFLAFFVSLFVCL